MAHPRESEEWKSMTMQQRYGAKVDVSLTPIAWATPDRVKQSWELKLDSLVHHVSPSACLQE